MTVWVKVVYNFGDMTTVHYMNMASIEDVSYSLEYPVFGHLCITLKNAFVEKETENKIELCMDDEVAKKLLKDLAKKLLPKEIYEKSVKEEGETKDG